MIVPTQTSPATTTGKLHPTNKSEAGQAIQIYYQPQAVPVRQAILGKPRQHVERASGAYQ
jgi:hypothetical protein